MRAYDLTILADRKDPTQVLHDMILDHYTLRADLKSLVYEIEDLATQYTNLQWLYGHIDNMWSDPVFQDMVGLELSKYGITSSVEVENGISKTMTNMLTKIKEFFTKMMEYLRKVFQINTKNTSVVLRALAKELEDQKKREKAKSEFTTHGESVTSITNLLVGILKQQDAYSDALNKLHALKSNQEKEDVQGAKESSKSENTELEKILSQLQTESGKGDDRRNTEDGMDPVNGGWFDSQKLSELAFQFETMTKLIGTMRDIQSRCNAISSDIKSNTQMTKEIGKTKIDTIKNTIKSIENQIKLVMDYSTKVGKKSQTILNIVKDTPKV